MEYYISALKTQYFSEKEKSEVLWQSKIDECKEFVTFEDAANYVLVDLKFPTKQGHKYNSYSWIPTMFEPSTYVTKKGFEFRGFYREGKYEADVLTMFVMDIDHDKTDERVSMDDAMWIARNNLGNCFSYTTYSDSPEKPKYRLVMEPSRPLTRQESFKIAAFLNVDFFAKAADLSIYDPGDHIYAPPFNGEASTWFDGSPMDVDMYLELAEEFLEANPELKQREKKVVNLEDMVISSVGDIGTIGNVGLANPIIWNREWDNDYRNTVVNTSHWETMRMLLARVWTKTSGRLGRYDLLQILGEIDQTDGGYFGRKYDHQKALELVDWVASSPHPEYIEHTQAPSTVLAMIAKASVVAKGDGGAKQANPSRLRLFSHPCVKARELKLWLNGVKDGGWYGGKLTKRLSDANKKDDFKELARQCLMIKADTKLEEMINEE